MNTKQRTNLFESLQTLPLQLTHFLLKTPNLIINSKLSKAFLESYALNFKILGGSFITFASITAFTNHNVSLPIAAISTLVFGSAQATLHKNTNGPSATARALTTAMFLFGSISGAVLGNFPRIISGEFQNTQTAQHPLPSSLGLN